MRHRRLKGEDNLNFLSISSEKLRFIIILMEMRESKDNLNLTIFSGMPCIGPWQ